MTGTNLSIEQVPLHGVSLIEASAGTGKTYTLAALIVRLILEAELHVDEILVVTYTRAATAELRVRVRKRIVQAIAALDGAPPAGDAQLETLAREAQRTGQTARQRKHLQEALRSFDEAAIFTIHGFCQRVLRRHAFESGVAFEAVHQAGGEGTPIVVVLNDNGMSIAPNVGAMSRYFNRVRLNPKLWHAREGVEGGLTKLPAGIGNAFERLGPHFKESIKAFWAPGLWWEELDFAYMGVIDGHDVRAVRRALREALAAGALLFSEAGNAEAAALLADRREAVFYDDDLETLLAYYLDHEDERAAGLAAQSDLVANARANGMRVVGPNCLGVTNNVDGMMLHMLFAREALRGVEDGVAFVGQSGGLLGHFQRAGDGRGDSRASRVAIVTTDAFEIRDCALRVFDSHSRRNAAKAASTSSSVAGSPARPSSIAASSSGEA